MCQNDENLSKSVQVMSKILNAVPKGCSSEDLWETWVNRPNVSSLWKVGHFVESSSVGKHRMIMDFLAWTIKHLSVGNWSHGCSGLQLSYCVYVALCFVPICQWGRQIMCLWRWFVKDVAGALNCEYVLRALAMDSVNRQRFHVDCVATSAPPTAKFVGIKELQAVLERLAVSTR